MKINYGEIITKANARKDALKEFGNWVTQLNDLLDQLKALKTDVGHLEAAARALDTEAVALVGSGKVQAILQFVGQVRYAHGQIFERQNNRESINEVLQRLISD